MLSQYGLESYMKHQTAELQREAKMLAVARYLKEPAPKAPRRALPRFWRVLRGGIDQSPTAA